MNKISCACAVAAAGLLAASCDDKNGNGNNPADASFEVSIVEDGNTWQVTVVPSDETTDYVSGLIMEDDWLAAGGADGLVSYVETLLSDGAEVKRGTGSELFSDLFWQTEYYAFAAQVSDGKVVGTPTVESDVVYRPYVEIVPEGAVIGPVSLSDNGLWVVGNNNGDMLQSFLYDVRRDSLHIVDNVLLYDVTDDGVAYGTDMTSPIIYENGQITSVPTVSGAQESGFYAVTPDGETAVGYVMTADWLNIAIVYENGTLSELESQDLTDHEPAGAAAKGIGSNGNISGYLIDFERTLEVGCAWMGTEHTFDLYPKEFMTWNESLLEGEGAYENKYGNVEVRISPDGRYFAGFVTVSGTDLSQPEYGYVYDSQDGQMYQITDPSYAEWRPDAVGSNGLLYLSDVSRGISSQPYVWDFNTDKVVAFAEYARAEYGYAPEGYTMRGSVVSVSEDGRTIMGDYSDNAGFVTFIYFMPEN